MTRTQIRKNFIYPEIPEQAYKLGAIGGPALRPDGDWRGFLPPEELQERRGVESSACFVEAQQHAVATIMREKFSGGPYDFAARFNALLSGGTENGGNPLAAAESMRKADGLVPEAMMPFSDIVTSWDDFHSFKGANEAACRREGKAFLSEWALGYEIAFTREDSVAKKYAKLRKALTYSPVPMSVFAWQEEGGAYVKPEGEADNHFVECVYLDKDDCPWVRDTYSPFLKKLSPRFDSEFGLRWTVDRRLGGAAPAATWWDFIMGLLNFKKT